MSTPQGLKENVNKEQFFHRNKPVRRKLVQLGLPAASLQDATRMLGFHMMPAQRRKAAAKETDRSSRTRVRAQRCKCLPGGMERQKRLAGWWLFPFGQDLSQVAQAIECATPQDCQGAQLGLASGLRQHLSPGSHQIRDQNPPSLACVVRGEERMEWQPQNCHGERRFD